MRRRTLLSTLAASPFAALPALAAPTAPTGPTPQDHPDWQHFFADAHATGTIVVLDARGNKEQLGVYNAARAAQRFSPASTFKIPHTLFGLDAHWVRDEFQVIPWDGKQRGNPAWNQDQTLRSAMRNSTVWVYERLALHLGSAREAAYLRRLGYGNGKASGPQPFWIEGDMAISALEQVRFLQRLYRNALPFAVAHQRLVKDLLINEADFDYILRAKTGWSGTVGWWVGWVEWPEGPVFFALNIDTPQRTADLNKRQSIARAILESLDALPAPAPATPGPASSP